MSLRPLRIQIIAEYQGNRVMFEHDTLNRITTCTLNDELVLSGKTGLNGVDDRSLVRESFLDALVYLGIQDEQLELLDDIDLFLDTVRRQYPDLRFQLNVSRYNAACYDSGWLRVVQD